MAWAGLRGQVQERELGDHADRAPADVDDQGGGLVAVEEVGQRPEDTRGDRQVDDVLERHPPRERRIDRRADHAGHGGEGREPPDEQLAESQRVGLVVEKGRAERGAEPEEEDEPRDDPHLAPVRRRADRSRRLPDRRPIEAGRRLVDEGRAHGQRDEREARRQQQRGAQAARLREIAAELAHQDRRERDTRPLHRLEGAGEPARPAVLHHQRIRQDVGEREAEPHQGEEPDALDEREGEWPAQDELQRLAADLGPGNGHPKFRQWQRERRDLPADDPIAPRQRETGDARQRGREQEVALPASPEERYEIREEPVHGFDDPGDQRDQEEVGGLAGAEPAVLEDDRDRLVRQVPHALREVDDAEHDGEALGVGGLEWVQPRQQGPHARP